MRLAVAFIIMILLGCAAWSSHQHRPFALLVDEAEANTIDRPNIVVCKVIVFGPAKHRIVRT